MTPTNDDITAICSHAGIDPGLYRSFLTESDLSVSATQAPEEIDSRDRIIDKGVAAVARMAQSVSEPPTEMPRSAPRWRALRSAFDKAHRGTGVPSGDQSSRTLPVGSLSMLGVCGGVGVTTILATLGRMLSMREERVLLLDGAVESMLPLYFGAADASTGSCSFLPQQGEGNGSLCVVSRTTDETMSGGPELWQRLRRFNGSTDRFLVDVWRDMSASEWEAVATESVFLAVLIPDLHSAIRLRSMEQMFREREQTLGRRVLPFYLLNKFDSSLALHVDLRNALAQELGDRLLPFAIRRSDEVTHALAEGLTVADYAPDSAITQDFHLLLNWLQAARLARRASA